MQLSKVFFTLVVVDARAGISHKIIAYLPLLDESTTM